MFSQPEIPLGVLLTFLDGFLSDFGSIRQFRPRSHPIPELLLDFPRGQGLVRLPVTFPIDISAVQSPRIHASEKH